MHDAWAHRITDGCDVRIRRKYSVDDSSRRVARAGVHDDSGLFVDHDHVVVDEHHVESDRCVRNGQFLARDTSDIDGNHLTLAHLDLSGRQNLAIHGDRAGIDQRGCDRTAHVGDDRHHSVQSLVRECGRNRFLSHVDTPVVERA